MKKTFKPFDMRKLTLLLAALAACAALSCTREALPEIPAGEGTLLLSVDPGFALTRATPDLTEQAWETRIRKVDILVFDSNGQLNLYYPAGTNLTGISLSLSSGPKEIWAVINGPDLSNIVRVADLKATAIALTDNTTGSSGTFVMAGSSTCDITPAVTTPCSITVNRFAARVALTKIAVQLPPAYTGISLKNIMLTNVVANQTLDGTAAPATWYNKMGRTASGKIIGSSTSNKADAPALTFKSLAQTVSNNSQANLGGPIQFYGFANPTTTDNKTGGTFVAERTRLVVTADIGGKTYYYPVSIAPLERNKAYEVALTITGLGSEDPDVIPEKGTSGITVTINPWGPGSVIEESI